MQKGKGFESKVELTQEERGNIIIFMSLFVLILAIAVTLSIAALMQ